MNTEICWCNEVYIHRQKCKYGNEEEVYEKKITVIAEMYGVENLGMKKKKRL